MKRTYICSPLSAPTASGIRANMLFARAKCDEYRAAGFYAPWAPHAWLPEFMDDNSAEERKIALEFGQMMLANSDTIVVCGYKISSGMYGEIAYAIKNGFHIIVEKSLEKSFRATYPDVSPICIIEPRLMQPSGETRLSDQIRSMDDTDLAEFLESIIAHCADFAKFGNDACDECPLENICNAKTSFFEALTKPQKERG